MAEVVQLSVQKRELVGKGAARAVRREGLVPGVIYGDKKDPEPISIVRGELERQLQTGNLQESYTRQLLVASKGYDRAAIDQFRVAADRCPTAACRTTWRWCR